MSFIACHRTKRALPLYVGGDLNERRATNVLSHLEVCERCANEASRLKSSVDVLRSSPPDVLPPEDFSRFWTELRARSRGLAPVRNDGATFVPAGAPLGSSRRLVFPRRLAAAALLLVTVGFGWTLTGPFRGETENPSNDSVESSPGGTSIQEMDAPPFGRTGVIGEPIFVSGPGKDESVLSAPYRHRELSTPPIGKAQYAIIKSSPISPEKRPDGKDF